MDFITWWFQEHYIISTIITPGLTLVWCGFNGLLVRGIITFFIWGAAGSR